jgi:integrase/recombinase XerD
MPYQYVREPIAADESDRPSNACETLTERLVVWTLLDTGLRVSELCGLTAKDILWQQRQLRIKGKGGPHGRKTKVRVVPMSTRVRAILEHHFALEKTFPIKKRRAQDIVKAVANRAAITEDVSPHVLWPTFAATALQKGISLPTVQKILGHDRLQTTAIYLNFIDVHIQDGLFRSPGPMLILLANSRRWPISRSLGRMGSPGGRNPRSRATRANSPTESKATRTPSSPPGDQDFPVSDPGNPRGTRLPTGLSIP